MAALREEDMDWYQCVIDQFPSLIGCHHTLSLIVIKGEKLIDKVLFLYIE